MRTRGPVLVLLVALALATPCESGERLVLIGGSPRPPAALQRFLEWAGGARAHVLIVPWGSSEPAEYVAALLEDLAPHRPGPVTVAPFLPLDDAARTQLRDALARATGVFFTGGDQVRIMDVLKDEELLAAFRARYRAGVVFGGTSAGTAIMSPCMITGNGDFTVIDAAQVETRPGLGLLPGAILDQHFVKRQRQNRLFGLVLAHPTELGVGIDEGTALLLENGRRGTVVGAGVVMLIDGAAERGALVIRLAREGQTVDLRKRRVR